jgi:predicted metal-dependent TIM-barrel fold hydrolase
MAMIPIIDCHVHMDVRNANDYELMAVSGVEKVVVPCSFTGEARPDAESYARYYDRLLGLEKMRAEAYGIELHVAVAVDPQDMTDDGAVNRAVDALAGYLEDPAVCALGEMELKTFSERELSAFVRQLRLADRLKAPVLLKAPRLDKRVNLPRMVEVLRKAIHDHDLDPSRILFMDLTLDTLGHAWDLNLGGYGIPVSPTLDSLFVIHEKATPQEALQIIEQYGADRLMFNTALHFGFGDPLALSRVLLYLKQKQVGEDTLGKVFYGNAKNFFWRK